MRIVSGICGTRVMRVFPQGMDSGKSKSKRSQRFNGISMVYSKIMLSAYRNSAGKTRNRFDLALGCRPLPGTLGTVPERILYEAIPKVSLIAASNNRE